MPDFTYGRDYDDDGGAVIPRLDERPVFPAPGAPLDVARKLYAEHRAHGVRTLLSWRSGWMFWRGPHWSEIDAAELRSGIYDTLGNAVYQVLVVVTVRDDDGKPVKDEDGKPVKETVLEDRPWNPDKRKVANVIEAMAAIGHLSTDVDPPSWIGLHSATETNAAQMISCKNGLLDLSTRTIQDHTPSLFNVVSVPFDYQPNAPEPTAWFDFLVSVWPDDPDSVALLQEYVGYVLSGRTDMQKMLLLIGPTRSGKGTIARMLTSLIGRGHVAGPTLASLGTNFGLSPLLGKPLAIISDARLGSGPTHTVVERLLSITGEDMLTVDRKFREPWSGKLPTRFVVLSNELPRFRDAAGAIVNRLLILQMTESFLHREDRTLDDRLRAELPGILAWALEGLDRLVVNGRFTVPGSSAAAADLMADLASPVSAFVRDQCIRDPQAIVLRDDLYSAWKSWAEDNGHHPGAKSTFGRDLRAVVPSLKAFRPRVGGVQVHCYSGIGLESYGLNGVHLDSPDSGGKPRGHGDLVESDDPDSRCAPKSTPSAESRHPDSAADIKPQVTHGETGESGITPFKATHSGGICPGCGDDVAPGHVQCQECYLKRQGVTTR